MGTIFLLRPKYFDWTTANLAMVWKRKYNLVEGNHAVHSR